MLKKIVASLLVSSIVFAGMPAHATAPEQKKQPIDFLFVQVAPKATLNKVAGKDDAYELVLHHINGEIEYFSDRPQRLTGIIPVDKYLAEWNKTFKQTPPNASIVGKTSIFSRNKTINLVMELTNPIYDEKTQTMTYSARALPDQDNLPAKNVDIKGLALFIDQFCTSCSGGGF